MADEYSLELVQGENCERTFTWKINDVAQSLADYVIWSQIRRKEDLSASLVLDLAEFMELQNDGVTIRMFIPGSVTYALNPKDFKKAAWDLFLVATADPTYRKRLVQGPATLDPATTAVAL